MMRRVVVFIAIVALFAGVFCDDVEEEDIVYRDAMEFIDECGSKSLSFCFKEKALKYIERLPAELDLGAGIRVKRNEPNRISRQYSSTYAADTTGEDVLDDVLLERIADYLGSHTFEFKLPANAIRDMKKSADEGRKKKDGGSKGGGNRMMNMMMLIQMKVFALGAIALKAVGLVAFKALLVAKVALTIASVIALKKLLEQKHHTSTYEVVAHPHEDYSHFDRSFNTHDLPYKGHLNKNKS